MRGRGRGVAKNQRRTLLTGFRCAYHITLLFVIVFIMIFRICLQLLIYLHFKFMHGTSWLPPPHASLSLLLLLLLLFEYSSESGSLCTSTVFFLVRTQWTVSGAATVCKCFKCGHGTDTADNRLRKSESRERERKRKRERDIKPATSLKLFHMQIGKQTRLCFD